MSPDGNLTNLWMIEGSHWSLPIEATWFYEMARCRPTGTLTVLMRSALLKRLDELGTFNGEDYFLTRPALERFGRPTQEPDDEISWIRPVGKALDPLDVQGMDELFETLWRAGWEPTKANAQAKYGALCLHLFNRLAFRHLPIDMGFCTIEPLPLRANWREILRFKMQRYATAVATKSSEGVVWSKVLDYGKKNLTTGVLFMYDKGHDTIHWTLTLRHRKAWWRGVRRLEKERRRLRGSVRYFHDALKFVRAKETQIMACLTDHLTQARRAALEFHKGFAGGRTLQKPVVVPGLRFTEGAREPIALDLRSGQKVEPVTLDETATRVRPVPDLRQEGQDVR